MAEHGEALRVMMKDAELEKLQNYMAIELKLIELKPPRPGRAWRSRAELEKL